MTISNISKVTKILLSSVLVITTSSCNRLGQIHYSESGCYQQQSIMGTARNVRQTTETKEGNRLFELIQLNLFTDTNGDGIEDKPVYVEIADPNIEGLVSDGGKYDIWGEYSCKRRNAFLAKQVTDTESGVRIGYGSTTRRNIHSFSTVGCWQDFTL